VGDPEYTSGAIVQMFQLDDNNNQWLQIDVSDDLQGVVLDYLQRPKIHKYMAHLSADGNVFMVSIGGVVQMFEYTYSNSTTISNANEGKYSCIQKGGDLSSLVGEGHIVQSSALAGDGKHIALTTPEILFSDDGAEFGGPGYRIDEVNIYSYDYDDDGDYDYDGGTAVWKAKGKHLIVGRSIITGYPDDDPVDVTLSHDGDFVVIGNPRHDESSEKQNAGMVRVYRYKYKDDDDEDEDGWEELGQELVGEDAQSMIGGITSISKSGTTLAFSRRKSYTADSDSEMMVMMVVEIYKLVSNRWLKKKSGEFSGSITDIAITDDGEFVAVGEEDAIAENQVHIFLTERIRDCSVSATLSFRTAGGGGEFATGYRNDDLSVWKEGNNETCSIHDQDKGWCFHDGNKGHIEKNGNDELTTETEKIQFIANVRTKYQVRIAHNSTKPEQFNVNESESDGGEDHSRLLFGNLAITPTGKQDLCNLSYNGIGEGIDWISTLTGPQELSCTNFERIGSGVDKDYDFILGITLSCDYECNCKVIEPE
jgi:hypothetical protein